MPLNKCILCGKWTNYSHVCTSCRPNILDEHDKKYLEEDEDGDGLTERFDIDENEDWELDDYPHDEQ